MSVSLSNSSQSYHGVRECKCDVPVPACLRMSLTNLKSGRRFYGCHKYGIPGSRSCRFFIWYEPPLPEHLSRVLVRLTRKLKEIEDERDRAVAGNKKLKIVLLGIALVFVAWFLAYNN